MKVRATKQISEEGTMYESGQEFDLSPERAKRLIALRMVEPAGDSRHEDAEVPSQSTPAKKGKAIRAMEAK